MAQCGHCRRRPIFELNNNHRFLSALNMPASRTSSIPPRSRHAPTPSPPKNPRKAPYDSEVISLGSSSDGENPRVPPTIRKHSKPHTTARIKKPAISVPIEEVIEISDDDSPTEVSTQASVIADFRRQINRMREVGTSTIQSQHNT